MARKLLREIIKKIREIYYFCIGKPTGVGYILMMHHVLPKDDKCMPIDEDLNITPEALEIFILEAKQYFEFIPLSDVPKRINNPIKRKFISITFDDGFESVYKYAYPILKRHNIPFASFVTSGFIGKECHTYESIGSIERAMSQDQLLELCNDSLVSIGGHTVHHKRLGHISQNEMKEEISGCIQHLKEYLGIDTSLFAYPSGDVNDDVRAEISSPRYAIDIALLCKGDAVTTSCKDNYMLPRLNLEEHMIAKDLLHCRNVYMGF